MTPQDQERIIQWAETHSPADGNSLIALATGKDKSYSEPFRRFCDDFKNLVPDIRLQRDAEHPSGLPALIVGSHRNLAFQILPKAKWLGFFLDAVSGTNHDEPALPSSIAKQLTNLKLPLNLNLYVSHQCPHCPAVIMQLLPLVRDHQLLRLTVIDAGLFTQKAQKDQIRAVPTLIMEEQFRWTGRLDLEEMLDMAVQQDPAKMSAPSLQQFLEAGHAPQAARMMIEHGSIFPALVDLLTDEKWPIRLAAMVTVESLVEEGPATAQMLVEPLWERFSRCPSTVRGDLAYILGLMDSENARAKLSSIADQDEDQMVREAACEALSNKDPGTAAP